MDSPVNVGSYTASAAVGDKTISKSFEIAGRTPITYYAADGTITTSQYIPIENNANGIAFLRDGLVYTVSGNVTIGALVYTGNVTLVLCENSTLRIRAGIYHIGSQLNIYTENGSNNAEIIVNGEQVELSSLDGYLDLTGTVSGTGASISGDVRMYNGRLTVNKGSNQDLVADSLTLGKNLSASGLTGGTPNADGSVTYEKAAFAGLSKLSVQQAVSFTGGGLRRRVIKGTTNFVNSTTDLRLVFGYALPEGAVIITQDNAAANGVTDDYTYFLWSTGTAEPGTKVAANSFDQSIKICSLVVTGVPSDYFSLNINAKLHLVYTLNDQTFSVDSPVGTRSVNQVCNSLKTRDDTWGRYAMYLLREADSYTA